MTVTDDSAIDQDSVNSHVVIRLSDEADAVQHFLSKAIPTVGDRTSIAAALLPWVCERLPSPHSRRAYFADLATFAQHMQRQGIGLLDVTGDDLRIYRAALLAAGKTPGTVGRMLSVLRGTYQQLGKRGLVNWELVRDLQAVESPPVGKNSTPALSEQEAIRLLHAPDTSTLRGLRDYALLFTFFKTACRCAAIANACVGHIERTDTDYFLVVWEKGRGAKKRQRKALLEAAQPVLDYIRSGGLESDLEGPLFRPLAKDRHTLLRGHISPRSILGIVQGYAREVGIKVERLGGRGVCTHSLRKTSLTNALVHGAKIEQVQALAGHSDIRTTQLYYQARERDADDAARHIQIR
jgi:site-specific recombinase XerD